MGGGHFSLLGKRLPPGLEVRLLAIDQARPFDATEWRDALVVVESGNLEIELTAGTAVRFSAGAVLFLTRLEPRGLRNGSHGAALLSVARRRSI